MMDHTLLALEQPSDTTKWVLIGFGAFVLIYLIVLRPMRRGRKDPLATPARAATTGGAGGSLSSQRAIERDMQNLLVEYEQMIRNMTAGLDTRAAKLEALIREADEKLAALASATSGTTTVGATPDRPPGETAQAPPRPQPVTPPPPSGPDPRHVEIYNLTDQGLSARDVARKLGRPNGEVELILALRSGQE